MRPCVAFIAAIPVKAADPLREMDISLPRPMGERPAAITADSPPLEPPGVRSGCQGFKVLPVSRFSDSQYTANSGMFVFINGMAPAFFMRATTVASFAGTLPSNIFDPYCVGTLAVSMLSLIEKGTP